MPKKLCTSKRSGFTLIELIIVMLIIAILAVGVMLGLNPVEQRRKADDSTAAKITGEIGRALYAYYVGNQNYPFNPNPTNSNVMVKWDYDNGANLTSGIKSASDVLIAELKEATLNRIGIDNKYYLGNEGAEFVTCYIPSSNLAHDTIVERSDEFQGMKFYILTRTGSDSTSTYSRVAATVPSCNAANNADWEDTGDGDQVCVLCLR